ncbi:MAG: CDP-diacylglycerol diphosphatase [Hyphomicrobiales bacterium]|nr:CDP-diacylglycerol diphosphatase [Hyphomicrobiales bacterium]
MQEWKRSRKLNARVDSDEPAAPIGGRAIARADFALGRDRRRGPLRPGGTERARRSSIFTFVAGVVALAAFATWALPLDRQSLWPVVNACVADSRLTGAPFPCLKVDLAGGVERGYVVLRPPFGRDTILSPARKIVGVEDPFLQSSSAPNYFADAWEAWPILNRGRGGPPDRGFALVVNSAVVRSQDQLHIHLGCLPPSALRKLDAAAPRLAVGAWSPIGPLVPHQPFWGFRTGTSDLALLNPFRLAAGAFVGGNPALLTIVVTKVRIDAADEFVILASFSGVPHAWWSVGADNLLSRCPSRPGP